MSVTGQLQNPNDILSSIQTLANQQAAAPPNVSLPSINLQLPNASDLDKKYQEFLNRASNDPDIVNYYNQLLQQAQGDTTIAQNFLENDYQTGTRNIMTNLNASLKSLGLTFGKEQDTLQNTLNQRGIALTQNPNSSKLTYAGGGEAGTEVGQLNESQQLRQEAEQRSAQQGVTGLGNTLQKGLTSTGQQLANTAQTLAGDKSAAIGSRAGQYYGIYQGQQNLKAMQAQQNAAFGGGGGGGAPDLSNPQKRTDYAKSQGFNSWGEYQNSGGQFKNYNQTTNTF